MCSHHTQRKTLLSLFSVLFYWLMLLPAHADTPDYERQLSSVLREYQRIQTVPDVASLVKLDERVRNLIEQMQHEGSTVKWQKNYETIGIQDGDGGMLLYGAYLLSQAHQLNPNSAYRGHTLCAGIIDARAGGWGAMPDLTTQNDYLKEFPDGYCARDAHINLATFYSDLYSLTVWMQDPKFEKKYNYKYDCFAPYINKTPYKQQARLAQRRAIGNFEQALSSKQDSHQSMYYWTDAQIRESLSTMKKGEEPSGWYWCSD